MGVNYYWITGTCQHCGRSDRYHIGKNSDGWRFLFQSAFISNTDDPNHLSGIVVQCALDASGWLTILTQGGRINGSDGCDLSPSEFTEMVVRKQCDPAMRSHLVMNGGTHHPYYQDGDGYEFTDEEFT